MRQFITRFLYFLFMGIIPIVVLGILYFCLDPFKVLRSYHDYSYPYVISNRDYISTTMFIKNREKHHYNSFVFGSSRTLAFKPLSWKRYLAADDKPYMFDASCETAGGIYRKLRYLDATHTEIKNVLIILCRDMSFEVAKNHKGHLFIKHPVTTGQSEFWYQFEFFKAYFNPKFLFNFYSYEILGGYRPFMSGFIENRKVTFDTVTNEINIIDQENEITNHPIEYYAKRKDAFQKRNGEQVDAIQRINQEQLMVLKKIESILKKNNTHYKVVLSPLYEQVRFSYVDRKILKDIFDGHLFDFTGKNTLTEPLTNYYEKNHYRPIVGDNILHTLYR